MNIFIDIETLPSQDLEVKLSIESEITHPATMSKKETIDAWIAEKKPAAIEEAWLKTSFDGGLGMIACIGIAIDDNKPYKFYSEDWLNNETKIIQEAFAYLDENRKKVTNTSKTSIETNMVFVGHNLVGFDLQFLRKRCVVLGIKPPNYMPFNVKPWDQTVYDTMIQWDSKNFVKLEKLAKILKAGTKGGIDGSQVWPMVRDGKIKDVADYCINDVEITRNIFNKMNFNPV